MIRKKIVKFLVIACIICMPAFDGNENWKLVSKPVVSGGDPSSRSIEIMVIFYTGITKGSFYSESAIRFSNLPENIFQITILGLTFEFVVYCY